MNYEEIVKRLGPCGIDCYRCVAFKDGPVGQLASHLKEALAGFEKVAPQRADALPALVHYQEFLDVLDLLSQGQCRGCRAGDVVYPYCTAKTCFREKNVDFCFQCDEYPCTRNEHPEELARRWSAYNDRMQEVGVEQFYEEQSKKPRY